MEPEESRERRDINEIVQRRNTTFQDLNNFFNNARKSFMFYKNEQYDDAVKHELKKRGLPALVINIVKEAVNSLSGQERQNKTDIVVRPIEYSDDRISEVLGRIIKWIFGQGIHSFVGSDIFKEKILGGLGWWIVYIDFSRDVVNGDIKIKQGTLFDIGWDSQAKEKDLSDCRYIIYECRVDKNELKNRFKKYKDRIDKLQPGERKVSTHKDTETVDAKDKGLIYTEYWYRDYEDNTFKINPDTEKLEFFGGTPEEKTVLEEDGIEFVTREVSTVKLKIMIEDQIIVYDGDNPYGISTYPFVPDWGYYELSMDNWEIKLQGEVEALKDVNVEKNKRRSQMAAVMAKSVHGGFFAEENTLKNPNDLINSGGAGKLIYYQRGKKPPAQIIPQEIPNSLVTLEQLTSGDQYHVGVKADLMGMVQEKGAPLGLSQLRAQQSIAQVQELFDNHSLAKKMVGNIIIELITKNFDQDKIRRILGSDLPFEQKRTEYKKQIDDLDRFVPKDDIERQKFYAQVQALQIQLAQLEKEESEFWVAWESVKEDAVYDCVVGEAADSPTYRIASLSLLMSLLQGGADVPIEMIVELSDVPKSIKEKVIASMQQRAQMQQQMAMQEQEHKIQSEQERNQIEVLKAIAGMSGKMQMAGGKAK